VKAYEFYWHNPLKGYELLGVLPERRKNSERITQQSVMDWAANIFADHLSTEDISYVQVTINEDPGVVFLPAPVIMPQK